MGMKCVLPKIHRKSEMMMDDEISPKENLPKQSVYVSWWLWDLGLLA
jgi:hypothetical protein